MKRLLRIKTAAQSAVRRRRHPDIPRDLDARSQYKMCQRHMRRYRRAATIWQIAGVIALCFALGFYHFWQQARTNYLNEQARRVQLVESYARERQERDNIAERLDAFMANTDTALKSIPISIYALDTDRLIQAGKAGQFEYDKIQARRDLKQCWAAYNKVNESLSEISSVLKTNGLTLKELRRRGNWSSNIDTGSE